MFQETALNTYIDGHSHPCTFAVAVKTFWTLLSWMLESGRLPLEVGRIHTGEFMRLGRWSRLRRLEGDMDPG